MKFPPSLWSWACVIRVLIRGVVARVAKAMGMDVIAYTASPRKTPESKRDGGFIVPGTGDPDGSLPSAWYSGTAKEDLHEFLKQEIDLLVIGVPLTYAFPPETPLLHNSLTPQTANPQPTSSLPPSSPSSTPATRVVPTSPTSPAGPSSTSPPSSPHWKRTRSAAPPSTSQTRSPSPRTTRCGTRPMC